MAFILKEDGGNILLQDGANLLLEAETPISSEQYGFLLNQDGGYCLQQNGCRIIIEEDALFGSIVSKGIGETVWQALYNALETNLTFKNEN
jgi:hypothetical protein